VLSLDNPFAVGLLVLGVRGRRAVPKLAEFAKGNLAFAVMRHTGETFSMMCAAPCRVITTSLVEVVAVIRECQHLLDLCVLGWTFPDRMNAPPWFRRPRPG
jgi:hypothetical protein